MDKGERQRLKTLANEAIIATFGNDSREQRLAEGLEQCVEVLDQRSRCPACGDDSDNPDWTGLATTLAGLGFRLEPL